MESMFLVLAMALAAPVAYPIHDRSGVNWLQVNDVLFQGVQPRTFTLRGMCRFEPDSGKWEKVEVPVGGPRVLRPVKRAVHSTRTDRKLFHLGSAVGLQFVRWDEDGHAASDLLFAGPILCNDVMIGVPPAGMIATCVPFPDHGGAMFVPDPALSCP